MGELVAENSPSIQPQNVPEKTVVGGSAPEIPQDAAAVLDDVEVQTDAKKTLTPKEQEEWREWMDTLIKNGKKDIVKPKEQLFIDEIGFSDYLKTFEQVSRQYGLGLTNPKIAAIEAGFLIKGVVDGLNPVRLSNWVWKAVDKKENSRRKELTDLPADAFLVLDSTIGTGTIVNPEDAAQLRYHAALKTNSPMQAFGKQHPADQRILAFAELKKWSPFLTGLATLPLSVMTSKASEALGGELMRVKEGVNKRVADSLLMVDFEFSQGRNPAAMIGVVERGKSAIDTLITHTYRSFIPGTAALAAATIPLVKESPVTAALAVARGVMLLVTGKARLTEAILENQAESKRRGAMEGRVMAIMNGLELVKTDDTQEAAKELAEQLTSRDKLLYGVGRAQTDAEKTRERIGNVFTFGTPIVSVGLKVLMDKMHPKNIAAPVEGATQIDEKPKLQDFLNPKKWTNNWPTLVKYASEYAVPFWNAYASQEITDRTVNRLIGLYHGTLKGAVRDIRKMEEYLGSYDALDRPDGPRELVRTSADALPNLSIKLENVAYKNILREATLEIPEGSFIAIQGVSGEGKSTLLRQMLGLYHPEGGSVTYGGVPVGDIKKFGSESLYAKIAYAPQNPYYFPQMTIRENIKLWTRREVTDERIRETLVSLGMDKFMGRLDDRNLQFSGGELRRLGLARALVKDPKILFLDEPTSNLDPETSKTVMDIIGGLRSTNPMMTVVAVTHDERFGAIADRVVTMKEIDNAPGQTEQIFVGTADATQKS